MSNRCTKFRLTPAALKQTFGDLKKPYGLTIDRDKEEDQQVSESVACKWSLKWLTDQYNFTYSLHGAKSFLRSWQVLQLVKKFPAFCGTRRFITAVTSASHLSLFWTSSIQSINLYPTSWRSIVILSCHLSLGHPIGLFPSGFPTKTLYTPLLSPYALHAPPISFFSILSPEKFWVRITDDKAPHYVVFATPLLPRPS